MAARRPLVSIGGRIRQLPPGDTLESAGDINPSSSVYEYENGLIVKIIEAGILETIITYNANGTVNTVTSPSGRVETYIYDAFGVVVGMTATGGKQS